MSRRSKKARKKAGKNQIRAAISEVVRPAPKPKRRGRKLLVLLVLAGLGYAASKAMGGGTPGAMSVPPPAPRPTPVPDAVPDPAPAAAPAADAPATDPAAPAAEAAAETPAPETPAAEPTAEPTSGPSSEPSSEPSSGAPVVSGPDTESLDRLATEAPIDDAAAEAAQAPAAEAEPAPAPQAAPADSLTSFFDEVLTETQEKRSRRR
ncbi:MAG TPA: hypothetical protein VHZ06_06505 [Marmoricola sp.]|jgi:hypothetical protein|nr:hypothetical protein [Marmoricola sp.]